MTYEQLLKKGMKELPEVVTESVRFEVPKVRGHIEGNKTIISNFNQIADVLHRPKEHILKFLQKELATPGEFKGALLIFGTKIPASRINEKIDLYVKEYVFCKECNKPDTKLFKEGGFLFIKCQACCAKQSVKG